jgi:hypothetical protein
MLMCGWGFDEIGSENVAVIVNGNVSQVSESGSVCSNFLIAELLSSGKVLILSHPPPI